MSLLPCPSPAPVHSDLQRFLSDKGFESLSPGTFSNGRATIRFEGPVMFAISGKGKVWRATVGSASPQQLIQLLTPILNSDSFLSPAELERRAERPRTAKLALNSIVREIREDPVAHCNQQLRRFLWFLFNGYHVLNLWRLKDVLDSQGTSRALQAFTAWMNRDVSEEALRQALNDAGEMDLWDATQLGAAERTGLDNAIDDVNEILRTTPPGIAHSALARAANLLRQAAETSPDSRPPAPVVESPSLGSGPDRVIEQ